MCKGRGLFAIAALSAMVAPLDVAWSQPTQVTSCIDVRPLRDRIGELEIGLSQRTWLTPADRSRIRIDIVQTKEALTRLEEKLRVVTAGERDAVCTSLNDVQALLDAAVTTTSVTELRQSLTDAKEDVALKAAKRQSSGAYPSNSVLVRVIVRTVDMNRNPRPGFNVGLSPVRWAGGEPRATLPGVTNSSEGVAMPGLYEFVAYRGNAVAGKSSRVRIGAGGKVRETVEIIVQ